MSRINFATPINIAPFALNSITTEQFGWISTNAWSVDDLALYAAKIPAGSSFYNLPKKNWSSRNAPELKFACWLLKDMQQPHQPSLGFASLTLYSTVYTRAHLETISCAGLQDSSEASLHLLITAIALWGGVDLLELTLPLSYDPDIWTGPAPLKCRDVLVPVYSARRSIVDLSSRKLLEFSMQAWLEDPAIEALQKKLNDLQSRITLRDKRDALAAQAESRRNKKRRGIIARLFGK